MKLRFTSDQQHPADGIAERRFTLGDIPGILWTPTPKPAPAPAPAPAAPTPEAAPAAPAAPAPTGTPTPLIGLGLPPLGLDKMYPRLRARAQRAAADGFASTTLELPGSGDRPRVPELDRARTELRRVMQAGEPVGEEIVEALVLPLVERAVPEWQAAFDALLALPDIDGPVGYSGGVISIGIRLALVEPRIAAAGLFAGSLVPRVMVEEARRITIPLHVLLQWDDEGNDRQASLDLFDAFGSKEKSLHANMGGHTGVPQHAGEDAAGFFTRHLK